MNPESVSRAQVPTPTVLVIFGASGNLAQIKLLPALYQLLKYGHLPEKFKVIGVFRSTSVPLDSVMENVEEAMLSEGKECDPEILARLRQLIQPITMDSTNPDDYHKLRDALDAIDQETGTPHQHIYYLAIPPNIFEPVIASLGAAGLQQEQNGVARRIFVEKPFGSDLETARTLIDIMKSVFDEQQIYRIDHYLAKETAQNILTFRFKNPLITSIWNREGIDFIHIKALETIDIERRANFYEGMGALRDLIQSHLLQLMALVMMDAPEEMKSSAIHEQKAALLNAIHLPTEPIDDIAVRGQYEEYRAEVQNETSATETYALVRLRVDLPDWHGVPVVLETGKALDKKQTEIEIVFRDREHIDAGSNTLCIQIQPDEGISLQLVAKKPGFTMETQPITMDFSYQSTFGGSNPEAYERVLYDGMIGDQTLFATSAEVLRSWEILQPIIDHWAQSDTGLELYPKQSRAPSRAIDAMRESIGTEL